MSTMRCPSCGASVNGAFCEYCGTKMPVERIETTTINAENVTVNHYYGAQPQQSQFTEQQNPFDAIRNSAQDAFANSAPSQEHHQNLE